jgi:branched-chain amino acid transport system permease protein
MATETPFEGDIGERRRQAVMEKLTFQGLSWRHRLGVLGILLLALVPTVLRPFELNSFTFVLYLAMFAMSWDVVSGYTGQLSFGHAFFFAVGGYGTSVATTQHGLHPLAGILIATVLAAVGGVLIGVPALRLEGPYLSLVTLIAPLLLYQSFILFSTKLAYIAPQGLGGTSGLTQQPAQLIGLGDTALVTTQSPMYEALGRYYISFLALVIVLVVCYAVTRSAAGSVFTAIREDEAAVRSVGLNPAKFKIFAFVLSGAVGGFAAAVWMHTGPSAFPNTENLFGPGRIDVSINVIVIAIIGGLGTIVGPIVGAIFFALSQTITDTVFPSLSPLPTFVLGMAVLVFMPEGIVPRLTKVGRYLLARRRGEAPESPGGRSASESVLAKYRREIEEIMGRDTE